MISVGRNAIWNIAGIVIPSMAGVLAIPMLLHGLGEARLGVFTLAIGLIGFSGLFDLGLGRALTQLVASEHGRGSSPANVAGLVRRALGLLLMMGVFWGGVLWFATPVVVERVFEFDVAIGDEAVTGLRWIAASLPIALLSTGLVGCLEGFQRFATVNSVRLCFGTAGFVVPGVVGLTTGRLDAVLAALALVRVGAIVPWWHLARPHVLLRDGTALGRTALARLVRFSAWLTVSNVIGPLMVFADRFYLASIFPPATVALYTVPLDAVSRLGALPLGAVNAAFPELARRGAAQGEGTGLVRAAIEAMAVVWFPVVAVAVLIAEELLAWWLNASMALAGKEVAQWLLLGVFLNGFAHIPYALLQSSGRADVTAKLHLAEFPLYVVVLTAAVSHFGILGAAMAWCARIALDTAMLFVLAARLEPGCAPVLRSAVMGVGGGAALLGAAMTLTAPGVRWAMACAVLFVAAVWLWRAHRNRAFGGSGDTNHRRA